MQHSLVIPSSGNEYLGAPTFFYYNIMNTAITIVRNILGECVFSALFGAHLKESC